MEVCRRLRRKKDTPAKSIANINGAEIKLESESEKGSNFN